MDNRKNDDKNLNNGGNNFFNKNPILIFAIFAIVIVIAFRGLGGGEATGRGRVHREVRRSRVR